MTTPFCHPLRAPSRARPASRRPRPLPPMYSDFVAFRKTLPRTPRLARQTVRARGVDFAVFTSPPVGNAPPLDLRQRRHAVRPLHALAGAVAARHQPAGHSVRPARTRRVDALRPTPPTRRSTTTPRTSARCVERSAFDGGISSDIRGAAGSHARRGRGSLGDSTPRSRRSGLADERVDARASTGSARAASRGAA